MTTYCPENIVPEGKHLIASKLCMTLDIGVNGNLFGGRMLEWLDEAGAIFAYKQIDGALVTLKMSEVLFKAPVREKDMVEIYGDVKAIGTTSITIQLWAINIKTGLKVCECEVVYVHVNDQGEKSAIPDDIKERIKQDHGLN
ncbi:MAG TPA: hotdog domain-containing protein [Candidatus Lokiarchaeia archaeon]|nr:hotdog domain-containing protein [Candidatus Lokiarchaeia archaeon]